MKYDYLCLKVIEKGPNENILELKQPKMMMDMRRVSVSRIWPLDDELGGPPDEVGLAKEEEGGWPAPPCLPMLSTLPHHLSLL